MKDERGSPETALETLKLRVTSGWPAKYHAIAIFSRAKASFTATERSLRS
jgi:hypothetical protein